MHINNIYVCISYKYIYVHYESFWWTNSNVCCVLFWINICTRLYFYSIYSPIWNWNADSNQAGADIEKHNFNTQNKPINEMNNNF